MRVEFRVLLCLTVIAFASVAICEEGAGDKNLDGKKIRAANPDDVNEEIEEQQRQERIAARKKREAEKLEAERQVELEAKRKIQQIRAESIAVNARYEDLLARKKRFDGAITVAQHEVDAIDRKISALNSQLQDLGRSSGGFGSRTNYDYSADRKVISEKIQAELEKRRLAAPLVDHAKQLAQVINAEYMEALNAKRLKDAELRAQKPVDQAKARPTVNRPRMIVSLIDGREFTTLMLIQDANEVHFFTVDGIQFRFIRRDVVNIRKEGEDKPE